jgi:hypothetical protein
MSSQPDQNYARSSLDRVFNALSEQGLRPTRHADHFMACCPVHGDNNPSLSVTYKKDTGLTTMPQLPGPFCGHRPRAGHGSDRNL